MIRDFYADGDDQVIFRKHLVKRGSPARTPRYAKPEIRTFAFQELLMAIGWHRLIPPDDCFHGEGHYPTRCLLGVPPAPRSGGSPMAIRAGPRSLLDGRPVRLARQRVRGGTRTPAGLEPGRPAGSRQARPASSTAIPTPAFHGLTFSTTPSGHPNWPPSRICRTSDASTLLPLALSRTQDDKGRVRWTLFGNSEQGPGKAFWKSFFTAPKRNCRQTRRSASSAGCCTTVYGEDDRRSRWTCERPASASCRTTNRCSTSGSETAALVDRAILLCPSTRVNLAEVPAHLPPVRQAPRGGAESVPRGRAPPAAVPRQPVFWGAPGYRQLHEELPLALQIPLLLGIARHRMPGGSGCRNRASCTSRRRPAAQPRAHAGTSATPTSGRTAGTRFSAIRTNSR